jgi:phenylacetate-CoA ligase
MQKYSKNEINEWQIEKLNKLLQHAYENTEYYRKIFNELKLIPKDIKTKNDLSILPILTKEIIRSNFEKLIPYNLSQLYYKAASTGGSSGVPLKFLLDNNSWSYCNANSTIYWEKTGYSYGDKYIALGSTSLFVNKHISYKHKFYYRLKNRIGVSGINMSDDNIENIIKIIRDGNIHFIYGYSTSIYLLAKYVIERNIKLDIKVCFSTSEVLTDLYRDVIIKAFNCIILDCYGARDGGISAFELKRGFYEVGYNSILSIDNSTVGNVILTDLLNYSMPLINYKLGDSVEISNNLNEYKYNGQIINKVFGRDSNVIFLDNGNVLTGPGFTILFIDLSVKGYNIKKINGHCIEISIIKQPEFSIYDEMQVFNTFKKNAGNNCEVIIKYVENFDNLTSGKMQYFMTE